jgi:general secretion pathway protein G
VQTAKASKAAADVTTIGQALDEYALNNALQYPDTLEVLVTPDVNGHTYLAATKVPKDPWGREYRYDPPKKSGDTPRVYSLGRDGQPGGTGEDADIEQAKLPEQDR